MSRTKVIVQKPRCTQKSKTAEKAWVSHWRLFSRENCRENMIKIYWRPSRKTREALQFALKKTFEVRVRGFRWVSLEKG